MIKKLNQTDTKRLNRALKTIPKARSKQLKIDPYKAAYLCSLSDPERNLLKNSSNGYGIQRAVHTANIINDFLFKANFYGKVLDFGPGQFCFSLIAKYFGAQVIAIDKNEPFITLGRNLGFEVIAADYLHESFDLEKNIKPSGIWMRGSFSAFVNKPSDFLLSVSHKLSAWANKGWGIIIPNNNLKKGHKRYERFGDYKAEEMVELQRKAMEEAGWLSYELQGKDKERYGMSKEPWSGSKYIFTINL